MARRALLCSAVAVAFGGCANLFLPDAPVPLATGVVTGRVVMAVPGRADRAPVKGVVVALGASTQSTVTDDQGVFALEGIVTTKGSVTFRLDADGDGTTDRQKTLAYEEIGAAPGRAVALGDVLLSENATLHGRVLRKDVATAGGHGGTLVFVPASPWSAFTADDGSFVISQLPEGTVDVSAFRQGYAPQTLGGLALRGGEDLALRDVLLEPAANAMPGRITGVVKTFPEASTAGASVSIVSAFGGAPVATTVDGAGAFAQAALQPGVYDLTFSLSGYTTVVVGNVAVLSGQDTPVEVTLGKGAAGEPLQREQPGVDAGVDGGVDAGMDAGVDAGLDAGTDAGVVDAGGLPCTTTLDCPSFYQCLSMQCVPLCSASSCNADAGQVCDRNTGLCQTACVGGSCGAGFVCDGRGFCRQGCDVALQNCAAGERCVAGACTPECVPGTMPCGAHQFCDVNVCRADGTCASDSDCPLSQFCVAGACVARPTAAVDAGAGTGVHYACSTACECRTGEMCLTRDAGFCVADLVPTAYLAADGGADGGSSPLAPTSNPLAAMNQPGTPKVLALRDGDAFTITTPPLVINQPGTAILGGYVQCSPSRWVRSDVGRSTFNPAGDFSTLTTDFAGASTSPATDVRLEGLDLPQTNCQDSNNRNAAIYAHFAHRLRTSRLRFRLPSLCAGAPNMVGLTLDSANNVVIEDTEFLPGVAPTNPPTLLSMVGGSGRISRVVVGPQTLAGFGGIKVNGNTGPVVLENYDVAATTINDKTTTFFSASNCGTTVTLRNSHLVFPIFQTSTSTAFLTMASASSCAGYTVDNVWLDGTATFGPLPTTGNPQVPAAVGFNLTDSTGSITNTRVDWPTSTSATSAQVAFSLYGGTGGRGAFTIANTAITAGSMTSPFWGVYANALSASGRLDLHDVTIDAGVTSATTTNSFGVRLVGVQGVAGASLTDVSINAMGVSQNGANAYGISLEYSSGPSAVLLERVKVSVPSSANPIALNVSGSSAEVYSSLFTVGSATGLGRTVAAVSQTLAPSLYLEGNTLETWNDAAQSGSTTVFYLPNPGATVAAVSNIFGAGQANSHKLIDRGIAPTNLTPASWTNNYFWFPRNAAREAADNVYDFFPDGGVSDGRNTFGAQASPYVVQVTPTYLLSASSPCLDVGDGGVRKDGLTAITKDVDGRPRRNGAGIDIGCSER
ncbi:MAG: carboxypeptidase regulatory-like domain-containing protein [Myxococcaceae bacterium]